MSGLALFCGRFDYSVYSNYYSQINPPFILAQIPNKRMLHFIDHDEYVDLPSVGQIIYFLRNGRSNGLNIAPFETVMGYRFMTDILC